jgi:hypothetical protein
MGNVGSIRRSGADSPHDLAKGKPMNALNKLVLAVAVCVAMTGCAMASGGNGAAMGTIYTAYKMGGNIGSGGAGSKTGQACATSILGVVALGDATVATAKAAGGITNVSHVDHDNFGVLGVYAKTCTIVVGD